MMEPSNPWHFTWSISNQVGSTIRTCEPLHINVDRVPITDFVPSYFLTVFPIDNGKELKSIVIQPDSMGNGSDWIVDEPVGSKLLLNLEDINGAQGGYLPHVFEVVAGKTTQCVDYHQHRHHHHYHYLTPVDAQSEFSSRITISDVSDESKTLRVDVHGGVPPYATTLIWLTTSGSQAVPRIPFYHPPLIHSIPATESDTLLTAVSDSNGKWALGSSVLHFGSKDALAVSSGSFTPQTLSHDKARIALPTLTSQKVLYKRSSDDGSFIIFVDAIAIALLVVASVAIILCHSSRRKKRRLAELKDSTIPLQDVSAPDLEATRTTNTNKTLTELGSKSPRPSLEDNIIPSSEGVDNERALPALPPPTPATLSTKSRRSEAYSIAPRSPAEGSVAHSGSPSSYVDPLSRRPYKSDAQSELSHKTSSSSNRTAKLIAKFHASYFGGSYEPYPFSRRSQSILSRNPSKSSMTTMRTDQQVPLSAVSTRASWYQISADAPVMPSLSSKDPDVQPQ